MDDLIKHLSDAPLSNILVLAGLIFLGIAVVGKISGKIEPGKFDRIMSAVLGIVLLVSGLYIHSAKHATLSNAVQTPGSASGVSEPKLIFDFLAEAPMARWMNGSGNILTWNGRNDDPKGFVLFVHNPHLENGSQPLNVLETHP